ncbi:MAG: ribonuclease HI [Limisphaerales bacterium]
MKCVTIHSDGACEGNPGPGGWGAVLEYGAQRKEISGGVPATTNNRMELTGAIEALRALRERCEVQFFTDSEYVKAGITKGVSFWKRNGWRTSAKSPVKNKDLWIELDRLAAKHSVTWNWLKGHAGHTENERCDLLARAGITDLRKKHSREQLGALLTEFKTAQAKTESARAAQTSLFA